MNDYTELRNSIEKFCQKEIEPLMQEDDVKGIFRPSLFEHMGDLGLNGLAMPESFQGSELGYLALCHALSTLSQYSVSYAVTLSVSTMVQSIIEEFATAQQKQQYLPNLIAGKHIGAFALSESHSGSDAAALKTTAKKCQGGYRLNGNKMWITSAGLAKTYIVMARTSTEEGTKGISAFILQDGMDGFSYGKKEHKMGWNISPTRELILENCFVPQENKLAQEGMGFHIAMKALERGRITIGAIAHGLAQRCLDEATKYALQREQFGQKIFNFQGLQFMLADMATETQACWYLIEAAAKAFDQGKPDSKLSSMAKLKATDVAMKVSTDALQVLGGVGYTKEYPVERFMRDAKALQIVEGTNQIQRVIIGRELKKEYS